MDNLTIRKAAPSDADKIAELRLLGQKHYEESNTLIWRITGEGKKLLKRKVESDLANTSIQILVAEKGDKVIGCVQGEVVSRTDYLPRVVGQVSLACVVKQFRRKGVGKRLIRELLAFFSACEVECLTVRYVVGNAEAEAFWRQLGFEPIIITSSMPLRELGSKLERIAS